MSQATLASVAPGISEALVATEIPGAIGADGSRAGVDVLLGDDISTMGRPATGGGEYGRVRGSFLVGYRLTPVVFRTGR